MQVAPVKHKHFHPPKVKSYCPVKYPGDTSNLVDWKKEKTDQGSRRRLPCQEGRAHFKENSHLEESTLDHVWDTIQKMGQRQWTSWQPMFLGRGKGIPGSATGCWGTTCCSHSRSPKMWVTSNFTRATHRLGEWPTLELPISVSRVAPSTSFGSTPRAWERKADGCI